MAGSRLCIRPSFYIFWGIFCLFDRDGMLPLFVVSAVIHELGHALAAYACGGTMRRLTLEACGARMELELPGGYGRDAAVTLAGPAVGLAASFCFARMGRMEWAGAGVLLNGFNCLPLLPLDGGRLLEDGLCMTPLGVRGHDFAVEWSKIGAVTLLAVGAAFFLRTGYNATLFLIGVCLLLSSAAHGA